MQVEGHRQLPVHAPPQPAFKFIEKAGELDNRIT
jgi:hypothetical protein